MLLSRSGVCGNLAVAPMDWGEYLLWHLSPGIKISYDGRREVVYSGNVRDMNLDFMKGIGAWDRLLRSYPSDMALVGTNWPCFNLLKLAPDWQIVYLDANSALFARKGSRQLPVLAAQYLKDSGKASMPILYFP